jgi:peptidoglycan hydrolase-like protein with peptidoglycan-binding domain
VTVANAQDFVNVASGQLGTAENPPNSNRVPYWTGIGLPGDEGQPWCAAFVTWCARQVGIGDQVNFVYCPSGLAQMQAESLQVQDIQPGDVLFFQWGDHIADHTGIAASVNPDTSVNTIEGNTRLPGESNDSVENRVRTRGVILATCRPRWGSPARAAVAAPTPPSVGHTPGTKSFPFTHPLLEAGATGAGVLHLQQFLAISADGDFGPKTVDALRAFQTGAGLVSDGACGPDTWSHLHPMLSEGSSGPLVAEIQSEVGCAADGNFGGITQAQVMDFQRTHGITIDGVVGPETYRAMFP